MRDFHGAVLSAIADMSSEVKSVGYMHDEKKDYSGCVV